MSDLFNKIGEITIGDSLFIIFMFIIVTGFISIFTNNIMKFLFWLFSKDEEDDGHPGFFKTREEVEKWLDAERYCIEGKYVINDDLTVDVRGSVSYNYNGYSEIEYIPVQFGVVYGSFIIVGKKLKSLKGCPKKVYGVFRCSSNQLTSLTGGPSYVGGAYNCSNNQLTSLTGAPRNLRGSFDCSFNELTNLKGGPLFVKSFYYCHYNKLTSLKGSPISIKNDFNCSNNLLTSLKYGPLEVKYDYNCNDNFLVTLKHIPFDKRSFFVDSKSNLLTKHRTYIKKYIFDRNNPGYGETDIKQISDNFIITLMEKDAEKSDVLRIIKDLKKYNKYMYKKIDREVNLDEWLSRLTSSQQHEDIIDL